MKIYTKKGDSGTTSLLGGARVPKHHLRIEAYGTVDELNSHIGMIRDLNTDKNVHEILLNIQDRLFTLGSLLALGKEDSKIKLPKLNEEDVKYLENEIDKMEEDLPEMRNFVLPGGHQLVSATHIARCVCRRSERSTVHLSEVHKVDELIIRYLNRLSDYLFVLSRKFTKDLKVDEIPWQPKKS
ncbi:MAG: ATP:cob(I)alamin adenosyltransferase [Flavobacteriales bacterium]|nr:ATP:cob(I)alamin adenosyltransferase [Flavobacteriales bacterium]|tara:strand:+ start:1851 stop:2402 length:552 start_codon:yes stop_codon:yes gene_type:complete